MKSPDMTPTRVGGDRKDTAWSHSPVSDPEKPGPATFASMDYLKSEADQTDMSTEQSGSGWSLLDGLRLLGRAAGIAVGGASPVLTQFRGYSIVTAGRDGAYLAHITHHQGKAIRLPSHIRRKIGAARFPNPDEAARHARFLILSGTLKSL